MKAIKTLSQLKNHPLVKEVWKEYQEYQYDDCDEVFWLALEDGYIFESQHSSLITTKGFVRDIVGLFNLLSSDIVKDCR